MPLRENNVNSLYKNTSIQTVNAIKGLLYDPLHSLTTQNRWLRATFHDIEPIVQHDRSIAMGKEVQRVFFRIITSLWGLVATDVTGT